MNIKDILMESEKIDKNLLNYQLNGDMNLTELGAQYKWLMTLRDNILSISFIGVDINELEQVRFEITEKLIIIRLLILDRIGKCVGMKEEEEKLRKLYKTIEV